VTTSTLDIEASSRSRFYELERSFARTAAIGKPMIREMAQTLRLMARLRADGWPSDETTPRVLRIRAALLQAVDLVDTHVWHNRQDRIITYPGADLVEPHISAILDRMVGAGSGWPTLLPELRDQADTVWGHRVAEVLALVPDDPRCYAREPVPWQPSAAGVRHDDLVRAAQGLRHELAHTSDPEDQWWLLGELEKVQLALAERGPGLTGLSPEVHTGRAWLFAALASVAEVVVLASAVPDRVRRTDYRGADRLEPIVGVLLDHMRLSSESGKVPQLVAEMRRRVADLLGEEVAQVLDPVCHGPGSGLLR
jgi:hypothetical protein